ncbi:hypothetical protein E5161_12625 [Cohnella pontilimi]|uniref:VanZ family protein n=1 Tax=Cohnella pontilimi TaxID=2564100 RepID=A0A4U0F940_9BACL|nr:hypothetical protein [Cohnella pontilimi]TJY41273.1 hypothetical protein E5161_12625 [Cohnella pontilimi]
MDIRNRKDAWNDRFELALYILAVVCFVYFLIRGNPEKVFHAALTMFVLLGIRLVARWTKTAMFPALRFSVLLFLFVTMFVAKQFGFYSVIPYLDKIEHLFSGVILSFVGLLMYRKMDQAGQAAVVNWRLAVWFSLFFAVAMAGCWEIFEFTTDRLFGLNSQNGSLVDTMMDIICGTVGAAASVPFLAKEAKTERIAI